MKKFLYVCLSSLLIQSFFLVPIGVNATVDMGKDEYNTAEDL